MPESKLTVDNTKEEKPSGLELPPLTSFYEVNGPLLFGAAQRAMDLLHASDNDAFRVIVIHLGRVPVIDATGFAALENAVAAPSRAEARREPPNHSTLCDALARQFALKTA